MWSRGVLIVGFTEGMLAEVTILRLKFGRFGAEDNVPVPDVDADAVILGRMDTVFVAGLTGFIGAAVEATDADDFGRSIPESGRSAGLRTAFL